MANDTSDKKSRYYRNAKDRYLQEKVDTFVLRVPKGQKDVIKEHAAKLGMSLNAYIIDLIGHDIDNFVSKTAKIKNTTPQTKAVENKTDVKPQNAKKNLPSWLM